MTDIIINKATSDDLGELTELIQRMKLDERNLRAEEFLIVREQNMIAAFGRIKSYNGFDELCSLGVRQRFREKHYGKQLTNELIRKAKQPLYLVTIIPSYFRKHGFQISTDHPTEIEKKINYCTTLAQTSEQYVVMKHTIG